MNKEMKKRRKSNQKNKKLKKKNKNLSSQTTNSCLILAILIRFYRNIKKDDN